MNALTHLEISPRWVGELVALSEGKAEAKLQTDPAMRADAAGLVHGGFTFGLADYAAMLAVNDPFVVLGGAEVKYLAPVRVGEVMTARAEVIEARENKWLVQVEVSTDRSVFRGTFTCFVLDRHVLER